MKPIENYIKSLNREKTDGLPIYASCISEFLSHYYGISNREFVDDPKKHSEVTIEAINEFELSCIVPVAYILFGCGPEMGVNWEYAGDNLPGAVGGTIRNENDVNALNIPQKPEGHFKNYLQVLDLLSQKVGDQVFIQSLVLGPHSCAAFLRGLEDTLLDPLCELDLYEKYMQYCVSLSAFLGRNIKGLNLPGKALLEIFLVPETIGGEYYNTHIKKYHTAVLARLAQEDMHLSNTYATFVDPEPVTKNLTKGELLYHYFFGTRESLEIIEQASNLEIPGFPPLITISGRMMADSSKEQIQQFIIEAADIFVKGKGLYPTIKLVAVQSRTKDEAPVLAEKMHMIRQLSKQY